MVIYMMFYVFVGEVIFDRNHPTRPPDIIFSTQDELLEFDPDVDKLKVHTCMHMCMYMSKCQHACVDG